MILKRRSIRKFKADAVGRERLEKLLEAARWAPSAGNLQPWGFGVVTSAAVREARARGSWPKRRRSSP